MILTQNELDNAQVALVKATGTKDLVMDSVTLESIAWSIRLLNTRRRTTAINYDHTTYGIKHSVEKLTDDEGKHVYIPEASVIIAAQHTDISSVLVEGSSTTRHLALA